MNSESNPLEKVQKTPTLPTPPTSALYIKEIYSVGTKIPAYTCLHPPTSRLHHKGIRCRQGVGAKISAYTVQAIDLKSCMVIDVGGVGKLRISSLRR